MKATVNFDYAGMPYTADVYPTGNVFVYSTSDDTRYLVCTGVWDSTVPGFILTPQGYHVDPLFLVALEGAVFSAAGFTQSYVVEQAVLSAAFHAAVN